MADRAWFFALQGQQHGPYREPELRQYITAGTVTGETLVWTEGMANWQKASDVPGLLADVPAAAMPRSGDLPVSGYGSRLSIDLGL
jgi:hypothetical protein